MIGTLLLLAVSVVQAGQEFTCTPVRVWDGDGPVWCAEGARIRLAGIAAREIDDSCRANQPCPDASAVEARDALVKLIGVPTGRSMEGHVLLSPDRSVGANGGPANLITTPSIGKQQRSVRHTNGSASSRISELTPDSHIFPVARLRFELSRLASF